MTNNNQIASYDVAAASKWFMLSMMAAVILTTTISDAYAGANAGALICTYVATTMGSGLGRAVATIGVLIVGVGATLGRMSWTTALTVAIGIAFMFTAGQVVLALSNGNGGGCWGN